MTAPVELPAWVFAPDARQRLGKLVSIRLTDSEIRLSVSRKLVGLIEDHQIIGSHGKLLQAREHPLPGERIHAHDEKVALGSHEGILESGFALSYDAKR